MSRIALNYFTPKTEDKELVNLKLNKQPLNGYERY